ncbi:hypothetical protein FSARC_8363 [Fusarium sarcochroum]|uniref:Uncharacterized protein n=1 Tax=Fusarium sarcochroum TaxID=1208366 RepID=A0A8H4TT30_9HYPO|nr:hypothetical protein FSARC_8363 [Fusarium sarcochroum]
METVSFLGLATLDTTLDSFANPRCFYEAAIFSFRNSLAGLVPDSLGSVVALCSLSHLGSCYLHNKNNPIISDSSPVVSLWKNAIRNHEHRQAFGDLIEALWPKAPTPFCTIPNFSFAQEMRSEFVVPHFGDCQETPPGELVAQDESLSGYLLAPFLGFDDAMPDSLAGPNFQFTSQTEQGRSMDIEDNRLTGLQMMSLQALQESAIITNLTYFLEECGELMHILSGRGVTAKSLHSCVTFNQNGAGVKELIKSSYIQPLAIHESFKDPSTLGILSIVNRFVDLGHLQSIDEARDYMIIIGRVGQTGHF